MDGDTWIQIILLFMLIVGASYCAASEISFASINKMRIKNSANRGNEKAKKALEIDENFDKALTTLLIGNNLTHIGFASLATLLATQLWGIGAVKYSTLITATILFLISELIPKSYAKANSEKFALLVSGSLLCLMKVFSPIVKVFSGINTILISILPKPEEEAITDEEIIDIIETAHKEGSIDDSEKVLVKQAIKFEEITVKEAYIKIEDVVMIDIAEKNENVINKIKENKFSRMPVYRGKRNNVIGFLQSSVFLKKYIEDKKMLLKDIITEVKFVKEGKLINDLLEEMSANKFHIAVVKDSKGKCVGIITLEDILEELVGEIWDENDEIDNSFMGERHE